MTVAGQLPALEEAVVAAAKVSSQDNFKQLDFYLGFIIIGTDIFEKRA